MSDLHEASFDEHLPKQRVLCTLCPHDCHIPEGARGACGVRCNHAGKLYTLVYDKLVVREVNPIGKNPCFSFTRVLSPIRSPRSAAICAAISARTGKFPSAEGARSHGLHGTGPRSRRGPGGTES